MPDAARSTAARSSVQRQQPALVDDLRDEAADVRVHAPGVARGRGPRSGGIVGVVAEQVLEHRAARRRPGGRPARPARAAAGRRAGRRCARTCPIASASASETWPASSIEEVVERAVELLAREEPGGAGEQLHVVAVDEGVVVLGVLDRGRRRSRLSGRRRTSSARGTACLRRVFSISSSRLWIALWLVAVTPTRLPRASRCDDQPRAGPGLAGAGRPLDEEVAVVERARRAPSPRRGRACTRAPAERRLAPQDRLAARG